MAFMSAMWQKEISNEEIDHAAISSNDGGDVLAEEHP